MYSTNIAQEFKDSNVQFGTIDELDIPICPMCGGDHGRNSECMREFYE